MYDFVRPILIMSRLEKVVDVMRWLPDSLARRALRGHPREPFHVLIALADHFEPSIVPGRGNEFAPLAEQVRRLRQWAQRYPEAVNDLRDSDGHPFKHTYFFPAEQAHDELLGLLAEHCHAGWGEAEIHLHHGLQSPDTAENTERVIVGFRDRLVQLGCLSHIGDGQPKYAFVHGNWALANSAGGRFCGVDNELEVLARTGCFADFTLPSAPNKAQTPRTNSLYEVSGSLSARAAHKRGVSLKAGTEPRWPLMLQGPLLMAREREGWKIENGELSGRRPPTMDRLQRWTAANIKVQGRPDWLFVKLHCHGMDPRDEPAMIGEPLREFLQQVTRPGLPFTAHFVTAREMANIAMAACAGETGDPGKYRDFRLKLLASGSGLSGSQGK